ncbi:MULTISPECIES: hypothetical protein [Muribaculaceae]|jgi:hypothetical protein|uniref:Uncharacterized protein n=1 Tax=Lepagella muris TaxID=3032870 RepID=A0AC61RI74_9BACT|nr:MULTISPECIES: hypothetical protein [Muribaculaceae]TGY79978.1 hypothetical protein E5331_04100 [Lepagella muris]THG53216.1 hypothetical protein E5984_03870 [Bacteroidales bacterium]TKC64899.1 hypothetical protein E5359_001935 [Bacteroidales bacterium]
MNKALLAKVKEKTKDTRLSEKYLTAITEKLGGSVEDDSTDEELIETTATLIADVATESQGEATRWAQKAKGNAKTKTVKDDDTDDDDDNDTDDDTNTKKGKGGKGKGKGSDNSDDEIATLRKRLDEMEAERTRGARTAEINAAFEKHKIPVFLRERLGKTIADDEDIETAVATLKQDCITNGLISGADTGAKAASDKQVDEAADALLESITAK